MITIIINEMLPKTIKNIEPCSKKNKTRFIESSELKNRNEILLKESVYDNYVKSMINILYMYCVLWNYYTG